MATFFGDESSGPFGGMEEAEISRKWLPLSPTVFVTI
jgi:hypothetical protein